MKKTITVAIQAALAAVTLASCANTAPGPMTKIQPVLRMSNQVGPDAWYQLGRYYQGQNRHERAELAFRRALQLDDHHAEAHNALGATLAAQGRLDEAAQAFLAGVNAAPRAAHIRSNLGRVYLLQGRRDEAIAMLQEALSLDPANRGARENLALAQAPGGAQSGVARAEPAATPAPLAPKPAAAAVANAATVEAGGGITIITAVPLGDARATVQEVAANAPPVALQAVAPQHDAPALVVLAAASPETPRQVDIGRITPVDVTRVTDLPSRMTPPAVAPEAAAMAAAAVEPTAPLQTAAITPEAGAVPAAGGSSRARFRLEVANGNGITGLARRVSRSLEAYGFPLGRLTNQKPYQQAVTQIQYRAGFEQQAQTLGASFPQRSVVIARGDMDARADVRIVLGHDLPRDFALNLDPAAAPLRLAAAAADLNNE